jgi:hypothetical protein
MPREKLVSVKFIALCRPFTFKGRYFTIYNPGEVAGFEPDIAALLIERGIAERVEPGTKAT